MIIAKYNITPGSGSNASVGSTAVAGGSGSGYSVDLTPITDKLAALESKVSQLELQLSRAQAVLAGLDSKYLSKYGDRSDYTYFLGALYTDYLQSEMFGNGVGFRLSGNATAAVDDKYNLIIRDVGWASIPFSPIRQDNVTVVDANTDEATAQLNAVGISIGATSAAGYLLIDCGATLNNERCFTVVSKSVEYTESSRIGNQIFVSEYREAAVDNNGNFILLFQKADEVRFTIRYRYTYAFRQYGSLTSGTYRLYIQGTDAANNKTDCFAAATKVTTVNSSGVTVIQGNNGARITYNGLQVTTDGGSTWV